MTDPVVPTAGAAAPPVTPLSPGPLLSLRRADEAIGVLCAVAIVLSITWGVVTRYLFPQPASWTFEVAVIAFGWLVFFGSAACIRWRMHADVDALVAMFPPAVRRGIFIFNWWLLAGLFVTLTAMFVWQAVIAHSIRVVVIDIPRSVVYGPMALASLLMLVQHVLLKPLGQGLEMATVVGDVAVSSLHLWLPAILMLVLLALQTPITWAMAIAALGFFVLNLGEMPLANFAQQMAEGTESVSLLALPLFVLAGCVMNASGITRRLLNLAEVLVGHMTGALAQMCTVLATLLGGLTASANADAAMLAKTIGTQMVARGYSAPFAAVITSSAAIITALIPPSIGLIIYGFLAEASIGRLFAAGIVPGLLLAVALMFTTHVLAIKRKYRPQRATRANARELGHALIDGLWALSIPVVIILGTRYGIFTTTESGAIVVLYVLLVAIFGYREMKLRQLPEVLAESVRDSASVMMMICAASAFGFYLSWEQVPQAMSGWLAGTTNDPILLLLLINLVLIVLGTAIEGSAALIILTPMLLPLIAGAHIDKVHFGIVLITNLTIAGITPPVGGLMYISSQTLKVRMGDYAREVVPYLGVMLLLLVILSVFPQISLWLPNLLYGTGAVQ